MPLHRHRPQKNVADLDQSPLWRFLIWVIGTYRCHELKKAWKHLWSLTSFNKEELGQLKTKKWHTTFHWNRHMAWSPGSSEFIYSTRAFQNMRYSWELWGAFCVSQGTFGLLVLKDTLDIFGYCLVMHYLIFPKCLYWPSWNYHSLTRKASASKKEQVLHCFKALNGCWLIDGNIIGWLMEI